MLTIPINLKTSSGHPIFMGRTIIIIVIIIAIISHVNYFCLLAEIIGVECTGVFANIFHSVLSCVLFYTIFMRHVLPSFSLTLFIMENRIEKRIDSWMFEMLLKRDSGVKIMYEF